MSQDEEAGASINGGPITFIVAEQLWQNLTLCLYTYGKKLKVFNMGRKTSSYKQLTTSAHLQITEVTTCFQKYETSCSLESSGTQKIACKAKEHKTGHIGSN